MWPVVLDVLRSEKPLYVRGYRNDQGKVTVFFGTSSQEPVGEAEGQRLVSMCRSGASEQKTAR